MPARDQQQRVGKRERRIGQPRAQRVAFEMVDRQQRLVARHRQRLGGDQPDHHPADQPRPGGRRDRVAHRRAQPGLVEHPLDQRRQPLGMGARGDLGHHPAVGRVGLVLRGDAPARGSRRSSVTSAAAVSSQLLSMPRTILIRRFHWTKMPIRASAPDGPLPSSSSAPAARRWPWRRPRKRARGCARRTAGRRTRSSWSRCWPAATRSRTARSPRSAARRCGPASSTQWLAEGRIDAAVHSLKDVETWRPDSLALAAMLPREDVRDVLVGAASLAALPEGARIGTSAPRRAAQVLHARPDCRVVTFRGNVATRLAKLAAGEADATLPRRRRAGAARRDRHRPSARRRPNGCPRPAQGAIAIECRADDARDPRLARRDRPRAEPRRGDRRTRAARGARRQLPQPGRGAVRPRRRRCWPCAPRCSAPTAPSGSTAPRPSPPATRTGPRASPPTCWRAPRRRSPRTSPGRGERCRSSRSAPSRAAPRRSRRAARSAWRSKASRCSRSARSPGSRRRPSDIDALLLGSANALRHGGAALDAFRAKPAYAVGEATAAAAEAAGFTVAAVGAGGLQALLDTLAGPLRLLRLAGAEHVPLAPPAGLAIETRIAYESVPLPLASDAGRAAWRRRARPAPFGRRSAPFRRRMRPPRRAARRRRLAALGPRIAAAAGEGWREVRSRREPREAALLALAREMCHEPPRGLRRRTSAHRARRTMAEHRHSRQPSPRCRPGR